MESQIVEYKEWWRDEYLKWICGFANAEGGKILIGVNDDKGTSDFPKDSQRIPKENSESVRRTYDAIALNPRLTIKELAERLGISDRTIKKHIAYLKEVGLIERVGGKTHGHWQVIPQK